MTVRHNKTPDQTSLFLCQKFSDVRHLFQGLDIKDGVFCENISILHVLQRSKYFMGGQCIFNSVFQLGSNLQSPY